MQPKRGRGRPRLTPEQIRKFSVHVTVNQAEFRRIKQAAGDEDQSVSSWARRLLLAALPPAPRHKPAK